MAWRTTVLGLTCMAWVLAAWPAPAAAAGDGTRCAKRRTCSFLLGKTICRRITVCTPN